MRHIGNTLFILAAASTIAAIWSPIGTWWQWLASAILLFLTGALAHGTSLGRDITATPTGIDPISTDGPPDANGNPRPAQTRPHNNYGTPA